MDPRTGRGALRKFRFGQSPDSNRSSSGMPKSGPCRAISVSKLYLPARSHREQAIARPGVWAATSTSVIGAIRQARRLLTPIPRRTTVDLGLHFFGVSLKLERGRIAIEDNG